MGSGTTCIAARALGRDYMGIELKEEYFQLAQSNLRAAEAIPVQRTLL